MEILGTAIVALILSIIIFLPKMIQRTYHSDKAKAGNIDSMHIMGNIYFANNKFEEAIEYLRKVVEARPNLIEPCEHLAWSLYKTSRYNEAIPHFKKIFTEESDKPEYAFIIGHCYFKVGNHEEAARFHERSIKLDKRYSNKKYS